MPSARSSAGSTPLTVPFVPTGMNAGVGTSPCAVRKHAGARGAVGRGRRRHAIALNGRSLAHRISIASPKE